MTKNFSTNVQKKRVGAVPKPTGNGINKKPKDKKAKQVWSPIKKVLTKRRAASPPPTRINFEVPLKDELHPRACFKQPFVTMKMLMKKADPAFAAFKDQMRTESLARQFSMLNTQGKAPVNTPSAKKEEDEQKEIQYYHIKGDRAYVCSMCSARVGEASLDSHAQQVHSTTRWVRPGQAGRPAQNVHCDKYLQHIAGKQGLKWHQQPVLTTNTGEQYLSMYHDKKPYELCKRKLQNGEVVTIKYRGFNYAYGDSMLADHTRPEDEGMDQAMLVHQARFTHDKQDVMKLALNLFQEIPHVDMMNPKFKLNTLTRLSDVCDEDGNEGTTEHDVANAKHCMNDWVTREILEITGQKVVETAEDLPEFQQEITEFPNEVIID